MHPAADPSPSVRPLLIALTGGIASGKSTVAEMFAELGIPVLDTDLIARQVVAPGTPGLARLVAQFGDGILDSSGKLDRALMRQRVFADPEQRRRLEAITHPAIREELAHQSLRAGGAYQIHVIPLLIESGHTAGYDRILVVDCPEQEQLQRLLARDGAEIEQARRMLAAQAGRQQRLAAADEVIVNTGTLEDLQRFVLALHNHYLSLARQAHSLQTPT